MIFRSIGPAAVFYRFHSPRWAYRPLSGEGAARQGGRFNRPGVSALYLSSDVQTAQAEYQQESALMAPATVVAYRVSVARILDLSGGYHADAWGPEWEDWDCDWRALAFAQNIEPPSWELADLAREAGAVGILFPSLKQLGPAHLNLVLDTQAFGQDDALAVHDPVGQLPKNQESWK